MSQLGEKTLMMLLTDTESLEVLTKEGVTLEAIPTPELRPVVTWALNYYYQGFVAPTPQVMRQRFGDLLDDYEIDPAGDVEETMEWAIADLKAAYALSKTSAFTREMAIEVAGAAEEDRVQVIADRSAELISLVMSLQPRRYLVDFRTAGEEMLAEYQRAASYGGEIRDLAFGLQPVDVHTGGIRTGELGVLAAGPKQGKSHFLTYCAYVEWQHRSRAVALFSLENSIEMTQLRLACMALHVPYSDLERGTLDESDHKRLIEWVNDVLAKADTPLYVLQPESGMRSPQAIVQMARSLGVEDLFIDQLSYLESPKDHKRSDKRAAEVGRIVRDLRTAISTGRYRLPCLLAHQINREGVEHAEQTGRHKMTHLAESSEVERTPDLVLSLYASKDHMILGRTKLQILAARRVPEESWELVWKPHIGLVHVVNEVTM